MLSAKPAESSPQEGRIHYQELSFVRPHRDGLDQRGLPAPHLGSESTTNQEKAKILENAVSVFQQAVELPPNERDAREIIARAYTRLGYTRWMLSMAQGQWLGAEPNVLAECSGGFQVLHRSIRKAAR